MVIFEFIKCVCLLFKGRNIYSTLINAFEEYRYGIVCIIVCIVIGGKQSKLDIIGQLQVENQ